MRVSQAYSPLIPLTLALSREGRGKRIKMKGVNAFLLLSARKKAFPIGRMRKKSFVVIAIPFRRDARGGTMKQSDNLLKS